MATTFDAITDKFMIRIKDNDLDTLYASSVSDFETYTDGILILSLPDFDNCKQDLTDYDEGNRTFNISLTAKEISIITKLMVITWWDKEINNTLATRLHLNDTDFKHYSESQNLREKSERVDRLREKVSQDMVDYGIANIPWSEWVVGNYENS